MDTAMMTAVEAAEAIRAGGITSEELVTACLDRIDAREEQVGAWTYLDRDYALKQARDADAAVRAGDTPGPLNGIPVGIKDIFDTSDMPTENGTILDAGRQPEHDATAVALLRQAGAVILGKTVTTEFAYFAPGKTRNPLDPRRTPGGSSSGSAAAVAAGMVPLAMGSQTNGSVIRPASFCGVYGYKPTVGRISRHGAVPLSRTLDHVGVFARTIEDAALMAEQMMVFDDRDPGMERRGRPLLVDTIGRAPARRPRFAFVRTPVWDRADSDTQAAFTELAGGLGEHISDVPLPDVFDDAVEAQSFIMSTEMATGFDDHYRHHRDSLSPQLVEMIERGRAVRAVDYNRALLLIPRLNEALSEAFASYDAILSPATTGEAPVGLASTGDPIFCTIWTLCGTPAISLPLLTGREGMPLGVQLVAPRGADARLLQAARWLADRIGTRPLQTDT